MFTDKNSTPLIALVVRKLGEQMKKAEVAEAKNGGNESKSTFKIKKLIDRLV